MKKWLIRTGNNGPVGYRTGSLLGPVWGRFLEDLVGVWPIADSLECGMIPALDIREKKDVVEVKADLPGVEKKDIHVNVEDDILTISGEKRSEQEKKTGESYRTERTFGKFRKSIRLPGAVKEEAVKASYKDGVLTVELPRSGKEVRKSRDIEIK